MGAVDSPEGSSGNRRLKKKHVKKRVAVRIDMTPMVDVAFLLLTFFMLTTVFSKPQTMEINLPPDKEATVEIAESHLLMLRVDAEGTIFQNIGQQKPEPVPFAKLGAFLKTQIRNDAKLVLLLKVDRDARYENMVDIIDELNVANITRFTIAPMLEEDKTLLAGLQGGTGGKDNG